jgi:hypothetical protein
MTDLPRDPFALVTVPVPRLKGWFSGLGLVGAEEVTVRRFDDAALQAAVDRVLSGLPADRRAAELEVGADQRGVAVVVAVKFPHGWSLRGGIAYDMDGTWGGKVNLRWEG